MTGTVERRPDDGVGARPRRRGLPVAMGIVGILLALSAAFVLGRASAPAHPGPAQDLARPGPVDTGFSQDMSTHHDQAVLMSSLAGGRAGPAVGALADSILVTQSQELGSMRGWLALWQQPTTPAVPMTWMSAGAASHGPGHSPPSGQPMPGMASPEELMTLWTKTGNDFDVAFLQLMLRHHQGGVAMAREAAEHADLELVRQAAATMTNHQTEEIGQMQALLASYGAAPLPAP